MHKLTHALTLMTVLAAGCSSTLEVYDITDARPGTQVNGIPFRIDEPYTLRVYAKDSKGTYVRQFSEEMIFPDQDRIYALNFDSDFFSNHTLNLVLKPDGTLSSSNLTTDIRVDEAITAFAKEIEDVGTAVSDLKETQAQAEIERLAKEEDLRAARAATDAKKYELDQSALNALLEVEAAQRALDNLDPDATDAQKAEAEAELRRKKAAANVAYRQAGRPTPYPGVF